MSLRWLSRLKPSANRFPQDQHGDIPNRGFLGPADGQTDGLAVADNLVEAGDFLGTPSRQVLETQVWGVQQLRHKVEGQVEGDFQAVRRQVVSLAEAAAMSDNERAANPFTNLAWEASS
jgi:hypothetical protein